MHEGALLSVAASPYGGNMTDLMRHVEFFDEDRDGILTIPESTKGAYIRVITSFISSFFLGKVFQFFNSPKLCLISNDFDDIYI